MRFHLIFGLFMILAPAFPLQAQAPQEVQNGLSTGTYVRLNLTSSASSNRSIAGTVQNQTNTTVNSIQIYYTTTIGKDAKLVKGSTSLNKSSLKPNEQGNFNVSAGSAADKISITDVIGRPERSSTSVQPQNTPLNFNPNTRSYTNPNSRSNGSTSVGITQPTQPAKTIVEPECEIKTSDGRIVKSTLLCEM